MPNHTLEVDISLFSLFPNVFINLCCMPLKQESWKKRKLTIGNHPTTLPPPIPVPFLIFTGRFAQRAITGYPF
jgi:hypothetical protein